MNYTNTQFETADIQLIIQIPNLKLQIPNWFYFRDHIPNSTKKYLFLGVEYYVMRLDDGNKTNSCLENWKTGKL